jgi:putative ABC transport system substrate-binding protein
MRRREFIAALGGAAAWPLVARAQQQARLPSVGVLLPYSTERDFRAQANWLPFKQRLQELGWIEGRNIRFEYRLTGENAESIRVAAKELVATAPDVIVPFTNLEVPAVLQATQRSPSCSYWYPTRLAAASSIA